MVWLLEKQQGDMVQPFGHFRWSLKRQSPDYKERVFDLFKPINKDTRVIKIFYSRVAVITFRHDITLCLGASHAAWHNVHKRRDSKHITARSWTLE